MTLGNYYSRSHDRIHFTREQASAFAKEIANDFNPLHNPDAKMFCVPGDLLFAVALNHYGLSQQMKFTFSGMVGEQPVIFPRTEAPRIDILDEAGKCYLTIERAGDTTREQSLIDALARDYVAFSGMTFPNILVPLMCDQGVMINPSRPLIIYQCMEINLDHLDLACPSLESAGASLEVEGKKGSARLDFRLMDGDRSVGSGAKRMGLRGLQPYEERTMQLLVEEYDGHRETYRTA